MSRRWGGENGLRGGAGGSRLAPRPRWAGTQAMLGWHHLQDLGCLGNEWHSPLIKQRLWWILFFKNFVAQIANFVSPVTPPNSRLHFSGTWWHGDTTPQWAWSSGWTLVSSCKTALFNPFIYKNNYSASYKFHVIPLNPITEIIIFPFSSFSGTFSKAGERHLGTWLLFRAKPSSVRKKIFSHWIVSLCSLVSRTGMFLLLFWNYSSKSSKQRVTLNQNSALETEYFVVLSIVVAVCSDDIAEVTVVQMVEISATGSSAQIVQGGRFI